jgi:membrane-associated phospholipid phosphatase
MRYLSLRRVVSFVVPWLLSTATVAFCCPMVSGQLQIEKAVDPTDSVATPIADSTADAAASEPAPGVLQRIGVDLVVQLTAPFRMDEGDAVWLGAGMAATGVLFLADAPIDESIRTLKDRHGWVRDCSPEVTELGGSYGIAVALLFSGYAFSLGSAKDQETTVMLAEVLATTTVWVRLGKFLTGRERPSAAYDHSHPPGGHWYGPLEQISGRGDRGVASFDAFPSGHTTTVFAIATIFARQYDATPYIPAAAYAIASIAGISRMIEHTHWASDVLVGACLGFLCGQQVVASHRETSGSTNDDGVATTPAPGASFSIDFLSGHPSVGFRYSF